MNRSKIYKRRISDPDLVYNSVSIGRFIGKLMRHGKKLMTSTIVYAALKQLSVDLNREVVELFDECILKLHPKHRLRPWRIASKVYPLPYLIKDPIIANKQAIHWLVQACRARKEKTLLLSIIAEIKDIFNDTGIALTYVQKRQELAVEYEAYVHYGT